MEAVATEATTIRLEAIILPFNYSAEGLVLLHSGDVVAVWRLLGPLWKEKHN